MYFSNYDVTYLLIFVTRQIIIPINNTSNNVSIPTTLPKPVTTANGIVSPLLVLAAKTDAIVERV